MLPEGLIQLLNMGDKDVDHVSYPGMFSLAFLIARLIFKDQTQTPEATIMYLYNVHNVLMKATHNSASMASSVVAVKRKRYFLWQKNRFLITYLLLYSTE